MPLRHASLAAIGVVLILLADQSSTGVVNEQLGRNDTVDEVISLIREARFASTTTLTILSTLTISSVTTTTTTTKKVCGVRASGVTINGFTTLTTTPTNTCRRRRLYWDQPVFIAIKDDDNMELQFRPFHPTEMLSFESTLLPEFRHNSGKTPYKKVTDKTSPLAAALIKKDEIPTTRPVIIDSSFGYEASPFDSRIAEPLYITALQNVVASIISSIAISTTLSTSTVTYYTSTSTSTTYTSTTSYYVAGACYPTALTYC